MAQLKSLFSELEKTSPRGTSNIAGYIEGSNFHYRISNNENLPAAVTVLDLVGKKYGLIYTNLNKDHWIYTYTGVSGGESQNSLLHVDDSNTVASQAKLMTGQAKVRVLADEGPGPAPLGGGGGLFQAAKGLEEDENPVVYKGAEKVHTKEKGLHRALRYYMLAAYALLGKCAKSDYTGGNYIAALMVDDAGRILSYGVNSGWFHHGEVNMLLDYFRRNSAAGKFPSKTIIFSTLTPCKQCSKYLQASRPDESVIFMGQKDPGSLGKVGEKFATYLDAATDPILNRVATPVMKAEVIGTKVIPGAWGKPPTKQNVYQDVKVGENVKHYTLDLALSGKMGEGASVAEQIGEKCKLTLIESMSTLTHKFSKQRPTTEEALDQGVKIPILHYLNKWISSANLTNQPKSIS
jgi:tRNA(Arg) A34 adenosine deaminase TadA